MIRTKLAERSSIATAFSLYKANDALLPAQDITLLAHQPAIFGGNTINFPCPAYLRIREGHISM